MIRLLKVSDYYEGFLRNHHRTQASSYADAWRKLMDDRFGWFDVWKTTLEATGKFSVLEVVSNDARTQNEWWRENVSANLPAQREEILQEQIRRFQPDVIFAHNLAVSGPRDWAEWGQVCRRRPLVFGYDGVALRKSTGYRGLAFLLTPLHRCCEALRSSGLEAHLFRPCFPSVCGDMESGQKEVGTVFVGAVGTGPGGHGPRLRFLHQLCQQTALELHVSGLESGQASFRKQALRLLRGRWAEFAAIQTLSAQNRGPRYGRDMYALLGKSRASLNFHVAAAGQEGVNMRIYESTGMGACLLTEERPNLRAYFESGREILTYRDSREALEKIRWIEAHPEEARKIGQAGQARTRKDHILEKQILGVAELIRQKLGSG